MRNKITISRSIVIVAALIAILLSIAGCKAKAPETGITTDDIENTIVEYVKQKGEGTKGIFMITDEDTGDSLELVLDKVHKKMLHKTGEDSFFACADFVTDTGVVYDIDFIVKGPDKENLSVTEVMIHKAAGKERYSWQEEDGLWMKKEKV